MVLKVGETNLKAMAMLDGGHTGRFGHPEPTPVRLDPKKGKAILVSGHDLEASALGAGRAGAGRGAPLRGCGLHGSDAPCRRRPRAPAALPTLPTTPSPALPARTPTGPAPAAGADGGHG